MAVLLTGKPKSYMDTAILCQASKEEGQTTIPQGSTVLISTVSEVRKNQRRGKGTMFKEIPNFSNYLISEKGVVINKKTKKRLSQNDNGCGYLQVQFSDKRNRYVHRLVAITFIDNPYNKPQVDHIDGNKKNNAASNLRWLSRSDNAKAYYAALPKAM